jgi:hypothetical protein
VLKRKENSFFLFFFAETNLIFEQVLTFKLLNKLLMKILLKNVLLCHQKPLKQRVSQKDYANMVPKLGNHETWES